MICPRCQSANPDEHRFCSQCGARLLESQATGATLRERMHHGLALLVDGDWERARREFEGCLALDPRHGASYLYMGLVECLEGAPGRARDLLARAVQIDPDLVNAWLLLGLMAESEEDFAEAERCFVEAVRHNARALLARQRLAYLAAATGDAEDAIPELRAWVEGQAMESAPLLHFGTLLADLGRHEEAAAMLDRALMLEPASAPLHRRRGDLARRLGRKQEAADHYRAALGVEPGDVETRAKFAGVLVSLGDVDGAIVAFEEALAADPEMAAAHYELGILYYTERGDRERALAELDAALRLEPDDPTARMIRQEILLDRERE